MIYATDQPVLAVESKLDHVGFPIPPSLDIGKGQNIGALLFGSDRAQYNRRQFVILVISVAVRLGRCAGHRYYSIL